MEFGSCLQKLDLPIASKNLTFDLSSRDKQHRILTYITTSMKYALLTLAVAIMAAGLVSCQQRRQSPPPVDTGYHSTK